MPRTPQEIFRILVLHNKLMAEEDLDSFMDDQSEPMDIIDNLLGAEMISARMAEKLQALYLHNLAKAGHPVPHRAAKPASEPADDAEPGETHVSPREIRAEDGPAPSPVAAEPREEVAPQGADADRRFIHHLLQAARDARASDLHVKAAHVPMVRVAGRLRELDHPALEPAACERALLSILTPRQKQVFLEKHDLDFSYDGGADMGRFRVSYLLEHRGPDGVFRLIAERVPGFDELLLPAQIKRFTAYRQGVVLITGPKGSGKTTTLAALIDLINATRAEHIITIEDPIEFVHPCKMGHVNQREVGPHTHSFANALRASLREAPDVIMVGELRDLETTSLAITAAETGHLVFATLHTPDAPRTIGRILDVFPPKEQPQIRAMFSESLRGVVSQQLVPGIEPETMHLAVEILFNVPAIGNLIRDDRAFQIKGIMQTQKKVGMLLMDESLVQLARQGRITPEEAIIRADNTAMMEKDLAAPGAAAPAGRR